LVRKAVETLRKTDISPVGSADQCYTSDVYPTNDEDSFVIERRRFERTTTAIRVEIFHPTLGKAVGFTMDISDGGAQVSMDSGITPPVGMIVDVLFKKMAVPVNAEPVPMKVMHCQRNVVGLMFVSR
jgi:hypothetical protein